MFFLMLSCYLQEEIDAFIIMLLFSLDYSHVIVLCFTFTVTFSSKI